MFLYKGTEIELLNSGLLSTTVQLDRESTPHIHFQLVCSINGPSSSFTPVILVQNLTLYVLDEDDNPPRLQSPNEQKVIDVYLKDQGIIQVRTSRKFW